MIYLIISFVLFLTLHLFSRIGVELACDFKQYSKLKKELSMLDKWFFISAKSMVKNRYSKTERRIINYKAEVKTCFWMNLFSHLELLAFVVLFLIVNVAELEFLIIERALIVYICLYLSHMLVHFYFTSHNNKVYHKKRMQRKK